MGRGWSMYKGMEREGNLSEKSVRPTKKEGAQAHNERLFDLFNACIEE